MNQNGYKIVCEMITINELSKWKRMVSGGQLTKAAIKRMKQAGIGKTARKHTAGLEKGMKNIQKQHGIKVKKTGVINPDQAMSGQYDTVSKTITIPKKQDGNVLVKRHEFDEAQVAHKLAKRGIPNVSSDLSSPGSVTYSHVSPEVLKRERRWLKFAKNYYPNSKLGKAAKKLVSARNPEEIAIARRITHKQIRSFHTLLKHGRTVSDGKTLTNIAMNGTSADKQQVIRMGKEFQKIELYIKRPDKDYSKLQKMLNRREEIIRTVDALGNKYRMLKR